MDNKIILELVARNLEEIKLLIEALRNGEKADPLLIEITSTKAKTLHQELMLLTPDLPEKIETEKTVLTEEPTNEEFDIQEITTTETIIEDKPIEESENQEPTATVITIENVDKTIFCIETNIGDKLTEEVYLQEANHNETLSENEVTLIPEIEINSIEEQEIVISETVINIPEVIEEPVLVYETEPEPTQQIETIQEEKIPEEKLEEQKTEIPEKKIIGEQFTNEPSLYERLSASNMHESKIKGKPVTNIMNAIGLNDRFLYIRELFANDSKSFENTIEQLDRSGNIIEAIDYLEANFKWTKNEASLKFMELLKRRFEN
jgi:hypothetical protein